MNYLLGWIRLSCRLHTAQRPRVLFHCTFSARFVTNCLRVLWSTGATENRCIFYLHLDLILLISQYLKPSKAGHLIQFQSEELGKNVAVHLIVCNDIPRLPFVSFPHIWFVHLAIITSIVTKHSRLLNAHQNHWCWYIFLMMIITFFPLSVQLYPGNKVTQNHMLVCQALITDRRWSTLFQRGRGASFQFEFSLFLSLAVLFGDIFLFQFYFRSGCSVQFVDKNRSLGNRLSQHSFSFCR